MNRQKTIYFIFKYIAVSALFLGLIFLLKQLNGEKNILRMQGGVPFLSENSPFIDSMLLTLSSDEKLGQMIFFEPDKISNENSDSILNIINDNKPGGIVLKSDSLSIFLKFRKSSSLIGKIEPFFVLKTDNSFPDFLKDFVQFPSKPALDAASDEEVKIIHYNKTAEICKNLGFNFLIFPLENYNKTDSFASVFFNETMNYIAKIQKNRIISTIYQQKLCSGDSVSNLLFQKFQKSEISGIFPQLASKSAKEKKKLFKKSKKTEKYGGLILHDISKIKKKYQDSVLFWLKKGNEIFITDKPDEILNSLKYLVQSNKISQKEIDFKVRKILQAKYWTNAFRIKKIQPNLIRKFCADLDNEAASRILYKNSVCILSNQKNRIPIGDLKNQKIVVYTFAKPV